MSLCSITLYGELPDPDADGRRMQPAAMGDQAVADRVVGHEHFFIRRQLQAAGQCLRHVADRRRLGQGIADLDAAAAHVHQFTAFQSIVFAAGPERDGIFADMPYGAVLQQQVPGRNSGDGRAQVDLGLRKRLTGQRQIPVRMRERQAAKLQVLHPAALGRDHPPSTTSSRRAAR